MDTGDIQQFTGKRTDLVTALLNTLGKAVADNQRELLAGVIDDFLDKLDVQNGIIQNTLKNKRLLTLLDQVFTRYGSNYSLETVKTIIDGVTQIVNFNSQYFTALTGKTDIAPIKAEATVLINSWLGITDDGQITPNGYLDTLVKDQQVKNQIRAIVLKNIVSQSGYNATKQDLKDYITGTDEKTGALESYYRNFVYDTYSQIDRANSQIYADKLNLNYAIYEGGIIKTTRPFCRDRNGKVFTREEIAAFDPPTAKPPGYNPFTDLGGYGCRHHLNWIPDAVATALRPDLKAD